MKFKNAFFVCASVCPCMRPFFSHCYINLNVSFMYKYIFTKFTGNVYGSEDMSVQNLGIILKKIAAIANCLKNY